MKNNDERSLQRDNNPDSDNYGFLNSINYSFDSFGFVDWKSLIPQEYLFPNLEKIKSLRIDYDGDINSIDDSLKLVKLAGIKHLARIRGYSSVEFDVKFIENNVISKCSINWIPNRENPHNIIYQEYASCNPKNSDEFSLKFAETIACNRSFVRCVRNFLNVHIVGEEEILSKIEHINKNQTKDENSVLSVTPQSIFLKICKQKGMSFQEILDFSQTNEPSLKDIEFDSESSLSKNIDPKTAKKLLKKIKTS